MMNLGRRFKEFNIGLFSKRKKVSRAMKIYLIPGALVKVGKKLE